MNTAYEIITTLVIKDNEPQLPAAIAQDICNRLDPTTDPVESGLAANINHIIETLALFGFFYSPDVGYWQLTPDYYELFAPCTTCNVRQQRDRLIQLLQINAPSEGEGGQ